MLNILHQGEWNTVSYKTSLLLEVWASLHLVERLPLGEQDRVVWIGKSTGEFTTKSAWSLLHNTAPTVSWHGMIWFPNNIPKHNFMAWKILTQRLPTQSQLCSLGIIHYSQCVFPRTTDKH